MKPKTWKNIPENKRQGIKNLLINAGGVKDRETKGIREVWRIRLHGAVFTLYENGTLFATASDSEELVKICSSISEIVGESLLKPEKEFLVGLDETGKGEVLGHSVLSGVVFPNRLLEKVEEILGVADTKKRKSVKYWDDLYIEIDALKREGMDFIVEKIPPWHVDKYNLNKIMDVVYQRILSYFTRKIPPESTRIVIDDYGIGLTLTNYLNSLQNAGAEVIVENKADERYLESRLASVIAKREREKVMEVIGSSFSLPGAPVGSGNAGDPETLKWLKEWKNSGKEWPWFVKRSYSTVRELNGVVKAKKIDPPIDPELLGRESVKLFNEGRLSVESLNIQCAECGATSKSAKIFPLQNIRLEGKCEECEKIFKNLNTTLLYYCGYILPDSSVILSGTLSKDLEKGKFFEGFSVLLHPDVRRECEKSRGGRSELNKLAHFSSIGRIRLIEIPQGVVDSFNCRTIDESIVEGARKFNAIIFTRDGGMYATANSKGMFCLHGI